MKFFKTITGIRAIDDGQEFLIQDEWKEVSEEEANLISNPPLTLDKIESQRILLIKAKAKELIEKIYPLYKQNNILMSRVVIEIQTMNEYITTIRNISNEAETNGTALEDIVWN